MLNSEETEIKQNIRDIEEETILKRIGIVTELRAYLKLVRSKLSIYEDKEKLEPVETSIQAEYQALVDFLQDKITDMSKFTASYDSLVHELIEIIKELDTKNTYNITEILKEYDW